MAARIDAPETATAYLTEALVARELEFYEAALDALDAAVTSGNRFRSTVGDPTGKGVGSDDPPLDGARR